MGVHAPFPLFHVCTCNHFENTLISYHPDNLVLSVFHCVIIIYFCKNVYNIPVIMTVHMHDTEFDNPFCNNVVDIYSC
jgi:glycogen synthase